MLFPLCLFIIISCLTSNINIIQIIINSRSAPESLISIETLTNKLSTHRRHFSTLSSTISADCCCCSCLLSSPTPHTNRTYYRQWLVSEPQHYNGSVSFIDSTNLPNAFSCKQAEEVRVKVLSPKESKARKQAGKTNYYVRGILDSDICQF